MDKDEIRAIAREEFRAMLQRLLDVEPPYTTHKNGPRPDGWGLRAWQRLAPKIPGAIRRGRYVIVPREAFAMALERSRAFAFSASEKEPWSPTQALREAGLRPSGEGR